MDPEDVFVVGVERDSLDQPGRYGRRVCVSWCVGLHAPQNADAEKSGMEVRIFTLILIKHV